MALCRQATSDYLSQWCLVTVKTRSRTFGYVCPILLRNAGTSTHGCWCPWTCRVHLMIYRVDWMATLPELPRNIENYISWFGSMSPIICRAKFLCYMNYVGLRLHVESQWIFSVLLKKMCCLNFRFNYATKNRIYRSKYGFARNCLSVRPVKLRFEELSVSMLN